MTTFRCYCTWNIKYDQLKHQNFTLLHIYTIQPISDDHSGFLANPAALQKFPLFPWTLPSLWEAEQLQVFPVPTTGTLGFPLFGREQKALGHQISLILLITELLTSFYKAKVVSDVRETNAHIKMELHNVRSGSCVQMQKGCRVLVRFTVTTPVFLVTYQGDLSQWAVVTLGQL